MVSGNAKMASQIESGDLLVASNGTSSLFRSVMASIISAALIASLIMLGSCYRQNMQLQQRLLEAQLLPAQEQDRVIGRIQDQLASETLILREEMLRTKTDSRGMDAALAAAQEQTRAALRRARACEEAFESVVAEMESLRVAAMVAADDAATDGSYASTGGYLAAEAMQSTKERRTFSDSNFMLRLASQDDGELGR